MVPTYTMVAPIVKFVARVVATRNVQRVRLDGPRLRMIVTSTTENTKSVEKKDIFGNYPGRRCKGYYNPPEDIAVCGAIEDRW